MEQDFYLAGIAAGVLVVAAFFAALDQILVLLTDIRQSLNELKGDLRKIGSHFSSLIRALVKRLST